MVKTKKVWLEEYRENLQHNIMTFEFEMRYLDRAKLFKNTNNDDQIQMQKIISNLKGKIKDANQRIELVDVMLSEESKKANPRQSKR